MQAGGGLIEHEQGAAFGHCLAAGRAAFGRFGQEAGEFEALRLATAERGHRLAQLHVIQTHIHDRLERTNDVAVGCKKRSGFADGQVQDVGDVEVADCCTGACCVGG